MSPDPDLRYADVDGLRIAYRSAGTGPGIVLLHGNPTSSYLWRDVLPALSTVGRCVAPDLVGMGRSDPLPRSGPGRYRFAEHRERLHFSTDLAPALEHARLLFVAVGTPPTYSGDADLSAVHAVVGAMPASDRHALVMKSTVPVGTGESIERAFAEQGYPRTTLRGAPAPRTVHLLVQPSQTGLTCTISDNGVVLPGHCLAPRGLPSHDRGLPEGGFGWYLIQDLVSELHYARQGERNCLTFTIPRHGKRIIAA